jgi:hypothetical protein
MAMENVHEELRTLVYRYARCADSRDGPGYAALFTPDGVLEVSGRRFVGKDQLAGIAPQLARYARTYHMVANCLFTLEGEEAAGEIYSHAHHLTPRDDGRHDDFVMYITYHDRYRRTPDGWRIALRTVDVRMTETRTVTIPVS